MADDFFTAGAGIVTALPIGTLAMEAAASTSDAVGDGAAARFTYTTPRRLDDRSFSTFANYFSRDFSRVRDTDRNEEIGYEFGARYTQPITPTIDVALSGSYGIGNSGFGDRRVATLGFSGRPTTEFFWNVTAEYRDDDNRQSGEDDFSVLFRIGYRFDENLSATASYNTSRNAVRGNVRYQNGSGVGAYQFDAGAFRDSETRARFEGGAGYTGNRFEASLRHDTRFSDVGASDRFSSTRARLATALAFAGNRVAVSRPIDRAFAIIGRHPTLSDSHIFLQPRDAEYQASSDFLGPAVLTRLPSYQLGRIMYDVDDLPIGYDLGRGFFETEAPHRAGYNLTVGSAAQVTVTGMLLNDLGEPLALISGSATNLDVPDSGALPLFSNRRGRFAIVGAIPGRYLVQLNTDPPSEFELEIPSETVGLLRLDAVEVPRVRN